MEPGGNLRVLCPGHLRTGAVVISDLSARSGLEQIKRYLDLADNARRESARAAGSARESYLMFAERWEQLAADTARQLRTQPKANAP
jgi:hypothetical protein